MLTLYTLASLLAGPLLYLAHLVWRNQRAFNFFATRQSAIPVLPKPSLLTGHTNLCYLHKRNWRLHSQLHEQYGPTFGWFFYEKPAVSTNDLDFIKAINLDQKDEHLDRLTLNIPVRELFEDNIAFVKADQWHRLRKAMAPAFSAHKVKQPNVQQELAEIVRRLVESLERKLASAQDGFIVEDVDDVFDRYALAVVLKSFYKQDHIIDMDAQVDRWAAMTRECLRDYDSPMLRLSMALPALKPLINWLLKGFTYQGVLRRQIMSFIREQTRANLMARRQLARSRSNGQQVEDEDNLVLEDGSRFRRNMIDYITDQYHNKKLSHREYFNSSFFLFFAANKTSAETISKLIFNLAAHPAVQRRLRQAVLEQGTEAEYLSWALNESMRLFPPAPLGSQRTLTRDVQTKAGLVPAGTHVFTTLNSIHRLPDFWGPDADQFKPERWANSKHFHPCQFMPFGVGKRNCFGKEFALQSIKLVCVRLLERFHFEAVSDPEDAYAYFAPGLIFCVAEKPINVKISRWQQAEC